MTPQRKKIFLVGLSGATALGGIAFLAAAAMLPLAGPGEPSPRLTKALNAIKTRAAQPVSRQSPPPTLAELQQLATRDLRRPLKADPATRPVNSGAQLTLQLLGTINEQGHSMAIFQKSDGTVAMCAIGESVDDVAGSAVVTRIDSQTVTLLYAGAPRDLSLPRVPTGLEGMAP